MDDVGSAVIMYPYHSRFLTPPIASSLPLRNCRRFEEWRILNRRPSVLDQRWATWVDPDGVENDRSAEDLSLESVAVVKIPPASVRLPHAQR